jgi:hypothetical protein
MAQVTTLLTRAGDDIKRFERKARQLTAIIFVAPWVSIQRQEELDQRLL